MSRTKYCVPCARAGDGPDDWKRALRTALCDWVEGNLYPAAAALQLLAERSEGPLVRYYQGLLLEQLGHYGRASAAADAAKNTKADPALSQALQRLRERLADTPEES